MSIIVGIYSIETENGVKTLNFFCSLFCLKFTRKAYIWPKIAIIKRTFIFIRACGGGVGSLGEGEGVELDNFCI